MAMVTLIMDFVHLTSPALLSIVGERNEGGGRGAIATPTTSDRAAAAPRCPSEFYPEGDCSVPSSACLEFSRRGGV